MIDSSDDPLGGFTDVTPISGGDISRAYRAVDRDGRVVFVKTREDPPPGMFEAEAASLRWLAETATVRVPEPLTWDETHLVLAWIEHGRSTPTTDAELGTDLAGLHLAPAGRFGLAEPANLATIPLDNTPTDTWPEFLRARRLEPLVRLAVERGAIDTDATATFDRLLDDVAEHCGPAEPPARLHGDLWSGNVLVDAGGHPWLVDPSSYGGHREVDLAMLDLFGGLTSDIVDAYDERHPLASGWRDRLAFNQLLPLLVHAVLFGGGYGARAERIARHLAG
ncbi:MAG TPA: fructosamine kinase family protein [Microthrixaceae bacterium]|nr:fructosamine kinase family protein [Microthrixaceae bacterium]